MAMIQFSCLATGPFIAFQETAERIFEVIDEPFFLQGAYSAEDLPEILRKLDAAAEKDRAEEAAIEAERERRLRMCTYDEELRMLEEEKEKERKEEEEKKKLREDYIRLYQRIAPLQDMIRRAIKHKKAVMWGPL